MAPLRDRATVWRFVSATALVMVALAAAYMPLRHNGFVNFDDDRLILDNPALRDLSPGSLGNILELQLFTPHYKPLVNLSWAIDLRLFGPDPRAFHRHNLMLHAVNAMLVLGLAALLAPAERAWSERLAWATVLAAIWALHPMKVESVAWAVERKDVLFAAFYLGAMLAYLRRIDRGRRRWLVLSALLALAAVLSKSTALTLPLALILIDLVRRRRLRPALGADKLPHLAVVALALYLYGLLPGPGDAGTSLGLLAAGDPLTRLVAAGHRHLAFAAHWLAPYDLAILYPVPDFLYRPGWLRAAAQALAHLALFALLAATIRHAPRIAAALLFYSLTLLPTLVAPVSKTNYLSDRYTYLPSLGLATLLLIAAAALRRRWPACRPGLLAAGVLLPACLGLLTYRQVTVWQSSERLWDHVLAVQPPHPIAYNNRGAARLRRGATDQALADFDRALAAWPDYPEALANRGDLLRRQGQPQTALASLERALRLAPTHPLLYRARGLVHVELGQIAAGIADYTRALQLDPDDGEALYLRAQARAHAADLAGAHSDIERAMELLSGSDPAPYLLRARIRARRGDLRGALADTTHALEVDPDSAVAFNNRGFLRLRLGDPAGALEDLQRALALRPGYPLARRSRGDALAALGRTAAACAAWRAAAGAGAPATASRLAACPSTTAPAPVAPP